MPPSNERKDVRSGVDILYQIGMNATADECVVTDSKSVLANADVRKHIRRGIGAVGGLDPNLCQKTLAKGSRCILVVLAQCPGAKFVDYRGADSPSFRDSA